MRVVVRLELVGCAQSAEEFVDFAVAPHPPREARKWSLSGGRCVALAHVGIVGGSIGPVGLNGNDGEVMQGDQPFRDPAASFIELGGTVRGFTKQDELAIGIAVREFAQLLMVGERLDCLGDAR